MNGQPLNEAPAVPSDFNQKKHDLSARHQEILDELLEAWEERFFQGVEPELALLCREYPELLPVLQSQVNALKQTAWLDATPGSVAGWTQELTPGLEIIPGYRLLDRLGTGGFGTVWRATGPGGVHVALKCLWMGEQKSRLEWKALAHLKELRHPHLLGLFGLWVSRGWFVVGSELAEQTLATYHRPDEKSVAPADSSGVLRLLGHLRQAAEALDHLHQQTPPLVHGDVKPGNLLLVGGQCKVGDFGLLRRVVESEIPKGEGVTLAYAAPETLLGKPVPASDQYALAMTYCHLRGVEPFTQQGLGLAQAHLNAAPNLLGLSPRENRVIAKALAKHPGARYPSCVDLVQTLEKAIASSLSSGFGWINRLLVGTFTGFIGVCLMAGLFVAGIATFPEGPLSGGLGPVLVQPTRMMEGYRQAQSTIVTMRPESPDRILAVEDRGRVFRWLVSKNCWENDPVTNNGLWASMEMVPSEARAVAGQGNDPFLVQEWETRTGRIVREYPGHKGLVRGVAISDDGALVASVSHQGAIQVNRRADGALVNRFVQEKKEFNAAKFTTQGDGLVVVSGDGRVLHFRMGEKVIRTLFSRKGVQFWCLARLAGCNRFLVGGTDGRLLEVDTARPDQVRVVAELGQSITELAVDNRSGLVLVGTGQVQQELPSGEWDEPKDYPVVLVDPEKGRVVGRFAGHKAIIRSVIWSEDGSQAFSSSLDGVDLRWTVLGLK